MFYLFSLISFAKLSKAQNNDLMINIPNKWAFRNDNENNAIVKAAYTGEAFKKDLWDFTICFRFRVLYFNPSHNGINLLLAKSGKEKFHFRVYTRPIPNKIEFTVTNENLFSY